MIVAAVFLVWQQLEPLRQRAAAEERAERMEPVLDLYENIHTLESYIGEDFDPDIIDWVLIPLARNNSHIFQVDSTPVSGAIVKHKIRGFTDGCESRFIASQERTNGRLPPVIIVHYLGCTRIDDGTSFPRPETFASDGGKDLMLAIYMRIVSPNDPQFVHQDSPLLPDAGYYSLAANLPPELYWSEASEIPWTDLLLGDLRGEVLWK